MRKDKDMGREEGGGGGERALPSRQGFPGHWTPALAVFVLLALASGYAAARGVDTNAVGDITTTVEFFKSSWLHAVQDASNTLLFALLAIEIAWAGVMLAFRRDDMSGFTAMLVRKIFLVGILLALIQGAGGAWNLDSFFFGSLRDAADKVQPAARHIDATPDGIVRTGAVLGATLTERIHDHGMWSEKDMATPLGFIVIGILIVASFIVAAAQMAIVNIECLVAASAGILFLGFGGSRWTGEFALRYMNYVFAVGIKLFLVTILVRVGMLEASTWVTDLDSVSKLAGYWPIAFEVLAGAMFFAILCWQVPKLAVATLAAAPLAIFRHAYRDDAGASQPAAVSGPPVPSQALAEVRAGFLALREGYEHYRGEGNGMLASALRAVGTSTVDYSLVRGKTEVAQVAGLPSSGAAAVPPGGDRPGRMTGAAPDQANAPRPPGQAVEEKDSASDVPPAPGAEGGQRAVATPDAAGAVDSAVPSLGGGSMVRRAARAMAGAHGDSAEAAEQLARIGAARVGGDAIGSAASGQTGMAAVATNPGEVVAAGERPAGLSHQGSAASGQTGMAAVATNPGEVVAAGERPAGISHQGSAASGQAGMAAAATNPGEVVAAGDRPTGISRQGGATASQAAGASGAVRDAGIRDAGVREMGVRPPTASEAAGAIPVPGSAQSGANAAQAPSGTAPRPVTDAVDPGRAAVPDPRREPS